MEGVSPPRSVPPPVPANNEDNGNSAVAVKGIVNALDSFAPGPTAVAGPTVVNNKDVDESNGSHDAEDVAPMRTRAVIYHAAKPSLLVYFHRVNWPLNNILPRGECFLVVK